VSGPGPAGRQPFPEVPRLRRLGEPEEDMKPPARLDPACDQVAAESGSDGTVLRFTAGGLEVRVQLSDRERIQALAALGAGETMKDLRARARETGLLAEGEDLAAQLEKLVAGAHAAGYALCNDDYVKTFEDRRAVAGYLEDLPGPARAPEDQAALERVTAMLREGR
jgi:hypothetical protein